MYIMKTKRIILSLLALLLIIMYVIIFNYYYMNNDKTSSKKRIQQNIEDVLTIDKVLSFIINNNVDNLDMVKVTFTNYNEISNNDLLKIAFYSNYNELDFNIGVSYTKINSYINIVLGDNINVRNEDIIINDKLSVKYDDSNEVYIYEKNDLSSIDIPNVIYRHVIEFTSKNGNHILKINKLYEKNNYVYSTYNDYTNEKNPLFSIPNNIKKDEYIKEYVENNYELLKPNLHIFSYTFIKEKSSLILKSYQIDK